MTNHGDDPYGPSGGQQQGRHQQGGQHGGGQHGGGDWNAGQEQPGPWQQTQDWQQPGPPGGPQNGPMMHQPPPPRPSGSTPPLEQNDIIALVLGLFLPGVGHMMLGQVPKGIAILVASVFTCAGFGLLGIAALVDLYLVARARKYRTLEDWEFFPDYKQAFNL